MNNIDFEVHVTAEKDSEVLLIPTMVYQQLMKDSLPTTHYTNQLMATRFSEVMWLVEQIVFKSFDQRLAAFLEGQRRIEGEDTLHMTHEEIAHHMGTAREVVTRMLKYFQSEGIVRLFRGGLTILNAVKLQSLIKST